MGYMSPRRRRQTEVRTKRKQNRWRKEKVRRVILQEDPEKEVFRDHEEHVLDMLLKQKGKILESTPPKIRDGLEKVLSNKNTLRDAVREVHQQDYPTAIMYLGVLGALLQDRAISQSKYKKFLAGGISLTLQGRTKKIIGNTLNIILNKEGRVIAQVQKAGKTIRVAHPTAKKIDLTLPEHPGYGVVVSDVGVSLARFSPYFEISNRETLAHLLNGPNRMYIVVPHIGTDGKATGRLALIIPTVRANTRLELKERERKNTGRLKEEHARIIYNAYGIPIQTEKELHEFFMRKYNQKIAPYLVDAVKKILSFAENAPSDTRPELVIKRLFDGNVKITENKWGVRTPRVISIDGKPRKVYDHFYAIARGEIPKISPTSVMIPIDDKTAVLVSTPTNNKRKKGLAKK